MGKTEDKISKESVGWRLPKYWMDKSRQEAQRLDLTITGFITMLIISYFKGRI